MEKYVKYILISFFYSKSDKKDEIYTLLFENCLEMLKEFAKEERVIVPLFKTLDFMVENTEINS